MRTISTVVKTKERMIKDLQDIGRQPPKAFLTEVNVGEHIYPLRSRALGSHYTHHMRMFVDPMP